MIRRAALAALLLRVDNAWTTARGQRTMPRPGDIDPVQLGSARPHVSLLDIAPSDPLYDDCDSVTGLLGATMYFLPLETV